MINDVKKILIVKLYIKGKRRPIILNTDKDKKTFMNEFVESLETNEFIIMGPICVNKSELRFFICE